ncbi:retrovirus-related pol polyprotein from transposon TNT 1-94 [Tanacetum coccineum]
MQKRINILENDVQRCQKQSLDFELQLQHEKEKRKCESSLKNVCETSWISKMEKLESENVYLEFQVQSLIKERKNVKSEYQKLFDSIKKTRTQTQGKINELIEHVNQKTYTYAEVRAQNQDLLITISELKAKLKNIDKGLIAASSVRGQSSRDLSFKNSVLANTKKSSERVEVSDRTNKKPDVASKNVVVNKKIVTVVDVKNAFKAKDILSVSCAKNVLIMCHDKCLANYKLNVHSKVRRSVFTTPRTVKSKFEDTTPVVSNTSVGQFCDGDLEVAFRSKTCYVRNLEGDDLLTRARESNLCTISISEMAASSPVCLMSKATSTNSWLWHRKLSHLNFSTIDDLTQHDLVYGLTKFNYGKDHLCSACDRGKIKKSSHPPKLVPSTNSKLEVIHMDLCRPMRVASINRKKYILVIIDDYSRFTWVYFLHTKDETPEIIKKFIAQVQTRGSSIVTTSDEQASPISINEADDFNQEDSVGFDCNTLLTLYDAPNIDEAESSTTALDPSNMHEFQQVQPSTHIWTKAHPLKQLIGDPSKPVMTRKRLQTDHELCMYALTVSTFEPKNIKEAMSDHSWIESMQDELHQF